MTPLDSWRIKWEEHEGQEYPVVCAWHKPIEETRRLTEALFKLGYKNISHGICPDCKKQLTEEDD
jgi:hypothetical protein